MIGTNRRRVRASRRLGRAWLAVAAGAIAACSGPGAEAPAGEDVSVGRPTGGATEGSAAGAPRDSAARRLAAARGLWESRDASDYAFTYRQVCFCVSDYLRPIRIEVRGGEIAALHFMDGTEPEPADLPTEHMPTIESLFSRLDDALSRDAARFNVRYDARLGYPASASVDVSEQIADEEFSFTVSAVELLPDE